MQSVKKVFILLFLLLKIPSLQSESCFENNIPTPLLFMVVKHMGQMIYNSALDNQSSRWQRPHVEYVANLPPKAAKLPAVGSF